MRFTVNALRDAGCPAERIYLSMERNMKCAIGLCGHCQFGPAFICKDGPGDALRHDRRASSPSGRSEMRETCQRRATPEARGLEIRLLRRLPAFLARLRGRAAGAGRRQSRSPISRKRRAPSRRALRSVAGRRVDHHGARCRAHSGGARAVEASGDDRRLRHRRRHPGAAQFRRRERVHRRRLCLAAIYQDACDLDADLGARAGRLRAAAAARSTRCSSSR